MADERQMENNLTNIETRHIKRYEIAREYVSSKNVLDIACGCGYEGYYNYLIFIVTLI